MVGQYQEGRVVNVSLYHQYRYISSALNRILLASSVLTFRYITVPNFCGRVALERT